MKIHELTQGTPEWLAYRAGHFNASDAPAMMGCSAYKTRAELLREMHTGLAAEVDVATQKRFDNGHRAEALARPLAEEIIGEELYPVVGSEGRLSASFDGLTLVGATGFEHKALNAELRAVLPPHDGARMAGPLPPMYRVQMEQQLLVSGASQILFMASQWTPEGELVEERHCWYTSDPALRQQIVAGWAQFEKDLAAYSLPAEAEPAPVGKAPDTLPALLIQVTGEVTASNLAEFKATALGAIRSVNRDLQTDQDFADAEKAVKWCSDVETRLAAAKDHALSQTASIDALFKTIDDISAEAKRVRLDLDKLVKARKEAIRGDMVTDAAMALRQHVATLNEELYPMAIAAPAADWAAVIKGKRSIDSMRDALDTELAAAKIEADAKARVVRGNLATFKAKCDGLDFLFYDLKQLIEKPADDFAAMMDSRIAKHRAEEAAKEARRKADEAARIAQAEQRAREQEAARLAEVQRQQAADEAARQAIAQAAAAPAPAPMEQAPIQAVLAPAAAPAPTADEPATLKLGVICDRLGFTVNAAFLADTLHIQPAATDRAAKLYRESQWPLICRQLQAHIGAMLELHTAEA